MPAAIQPRPYDQTPRSAMQPLTWLLLVLSAAICIVWFVHALGYWEDDAYIHLEFARSVAAGQGFSFNGHVVYGDTSPLWVMLLVATHALIPGWMAAGKTLTALGAVFALSGAFVFSRSLVSSFSRSAISSYSRSAASSYAQREADSEGYPGLSAAASSLFAAVMVLIFVANPYFGYWAFSGMEALTAAGLVCWGAAAVARRPISPVRFLLAALAGGLAPLLRPEMIFFTLLLGLILLADLLRNDPGPHSGHGHARALGQRLALLTGGLVLIAAPALLWAGYALHTFGMVVPNTNSAKRAGPHESVLLRLVSLYTFGFPVIVAGVLLLGAWLLWYLLRGRADGAAPVSRALHAGGWMMFVWTLIDCIFYVADHTYVQTRYIFVTAPVLTIVVLAIAVQRWPQVYRALVAFALVFGIAISVLTTWPLIRNKVEVDGIYAELAAYLRTLPADAPVAHYSIGEAAFLSRHPIVDTGGITRPSVIPFLNDGGQLMAWIYSQGAKYEVVDHAPVPGATLVWSRNLPSTGWFLNPREYRTMELLQVWKLPPQPGSGK